MAKKVSSKLQQQHYGSYKVSNRWKTNRERKLTKMLKQQPNNKQIEEALKNLRYRRKTPKTPQWTNRTKYLAQLIKSACGYCSPNIFNKNTKIAEEATYNNKIKTVLQTNNFVSFMLKDRVRMGVLK